MRYAQIRSIDISNGEGIGVALFVQGCHFHCYNCFNPETWNFDGGKEWTDDTKNKFLELINKPYIKRISFLGGDPLAEENLAAIYSLIKEIKEKYPIKTIWLYTGYKVDGLGTYHSIDNFFLLEPFFDHYNSIRSKIIGLCDVLVDDQYIDELRDLSLKWRGSSNQRVIDVQKSLKKGEVVLYGNAYQ